MKMGDICTDNGRSEKLATLPLSVSISGRRTLQVTNKGTPETYLKLLGPRPKFADDRDFQSPGTINPW